MAYLINAFIKLFWALTKTSFHMHPHKIKLDTRINVIKLIFTPLFFFFYQKEIPEFKSLK